jgi:hypothetical protein
MSPGEDEAKNLSPEEEFHQRLNELVNKIWERQEDTDEILKKAEALISSKSFQATKEAFLEEYSAFSENYTERVRDLGILLTAPLIDELDDADDKKDKGLIDNDGWARTYFQMRMKTIDIAFSLASESPGINPDRPSSENVFSEDPLEIGAFFIDAMGKRFGDNNQLTKVGFLTLVDGLVGTDISLDEEVQTSLKYGSKK